ncbi:MAG: Tryptophan-rich sensory protein [Candidatus Magasanikbacteria bacterium GW2011_GWD2_43_18]|uniref:Tryptophan-rich sensory protein n=1 Tax=Candidatus Magasanikbacteria bacterium GW2011_GWE2_42_7 TaxID=1619052 RepID=A0A0G1DJ88_9BACT|nr:MAG: Tryptophan-rich sensory protein [Candidatus Magasanikbacteria bacterium GW2011_GWE2_42_7]KKT04351.1 MAG: Tryptophan-rich sensory protein [Candidatus Magasanikbacteria bacterium GW2011_GWD2_43_18]KKT25346.1 MAG: Tryptophan-rich sensory protein [Candidatus Magasanikbacteria bacterium GW2011_GWA2_43_9]HBB38057.1 TspO protein [Candidatus Magasanikbacteria bacterium]HCC13992.1 TspO protein [Candidatus Magasanikbacteria bacterium]
MRHLHAKPHHFIIPTVAVTVAVLGALFTELGMEWYKTTLTLPTIVPPDWLFPIVWTAIYIMTAGAAYIIWHEGPKKTLHLFATRESKDEFRALQWLFGVNAFLNVLWTCLFFLFHTISLAAFEIVLLEITIIAMVAFSWKISRVASYLLLPYAVWVLFASYLTMRIMFLN